MSYSGVVSLGVPFTDILPLVRCVCLLLASHLSFSLLIYSTKLVLQGITWCKYMFFINQLIFIMCCEIYSMWVKFHNLLLNFKHTEGPWIRYHNPNKQDKVWCQSEANNNKLKTRAGRLRWPNQQTHIVFFRFAEQDRFVSSHQLRFTNFGCRCKCGYKLA